MFNKTTIAAKLTLVVGGMLLMLIVTGLIGVRGLSSVIGHYENDTAAMISLGDTLDGLYQRRTNIQAAMAAESSSLAELPFNKADAAAGDLVTAWSAYTATASAEEMPLAEKFALAWQAYLESSQNTIALGRGGDYERASDNMKGDAAQKFFLARKSLLDLIAQKKKNVEETSRSNAIASRSMLILLAVGLIVGGGASLTIVRTIVRPLKQMQAVIGEVEKTSDFTRRVAANNMDEVGRTARSFNSLMETLQGTLHQIMDHVSQVSATAQSLSSSAAQTAAGSTQQSDAAAAMAATVEQVTVSINHVSDSARTALEISRQSGDLSEHGSTTIHQASAEMTGIAGTVRETSVVIENLGRQSNEISSIVKVIRDVAEQTNLLALNAAIEAARAGEQGRGFAVVADEVRKLAERTTQATSEIARMIDAIQSSAHAAVSGMEKAVSRVDGGVALAQQAGLAINQIKDGSGRVVGVVNDISSALAEQSSASNDIAKHVEEVAQMSEKNSAAANRTAEAAGQLAQLTDAMRTLVSRFRI
ncbi:MAG: methyl-accepting chemotaxis protein [Betaproteobacteria bacterium]|nr:methyl-accepting chemotaxis protein [Betaproteobacteria bacterium]